MDLEAAQLGVEGVSKFLARHSAGELRGLPRNAAGIHAIDAGLQLAAQLMLGNGIQDSGLDFAKPLPGFEVQLFQRHRGLGLLVGCCLKGLGLFDQGGRVGIKPRSRVIGQCPNLIPGHLPGGSFQSLLLPCCEAGLQGGALLGEGRVDLFQFLSKSGPDQKVQVGSLHRLVGQGRSLLTLTCGKLRG